MRYVCFCNDGSLLRGLFVIIFPRPNVYIMTIRANISVEELFTCKELYSANRKQWGTGSEQPGRGSALMRLPSVCPRPICRYRTNHRQTVTFNLFNHVYCTCLPDRMPRYVKTWGGIRFASHEVVIQYKNITVACISTQNHFIRVQWSDNFNHWHKKENFVKSKKIYHVLSIHKFWVQ